MKIKRLLGTVILAAGSVKAVQVYINDEFEDIYYQFKKKIEFKNPNGNAIPKKTRVIVLGTGWAALSLLKHLDHEKIDLKVISPRSFFFYTPLLAGTATGTVSHKSIMEPIRWYLRSAYIQAECNSLDLSTKEITCTNLSGNNFRLPYDYLIVAVGAEPATFGIPGVSEYAYFMKEMNDSIKFQNSLLSNLEKASALLSTGGSENDIDNLLHFVVVGGGPTGVELMAELSDFIQHDLSRYFPELCDRIKLTLVEATNRILGAFDSKTANYAKTVLSERNINIIYNAPVTEVTANAVTFKELPSNQIKTIPCGITVWAGGISPRPITTTIRTAIGEKEQSSRWGLIVDGKFRVQGINDGSIMAIGDCAVTGCGPTAQAAYQQGKYLGRLLRNTDFQSTKIMDSTTDFRFRYQGALAYVGGSKAVAELKYILWDKYPFIATPTTNNINEKQCNRDSNKIIESFTIEGLSGFAIWRSLYFSKLMSNRNQSLVAFDWLKTSVFGRDIATPSFSYIKRGHPTPPRSK